MARSTRSVGMLLLGIWLEGRMVITATDVAEAAAEMSDEQGVTAPGIVV